MGVLDRDPGRHGLTRREAVVVAAGAFAGAYLPVADADADRLSSAQLAGLRRAARGRVLVPGAAGYDGARRVFNTRWAGERPPAVVQPRDAADVQAVVRWAGDAGVGLVARAGGHAYNGASTSSRAVVVDLRHLHGVRSGAVATIGPATRLIDVYATLSRAGRGWPGGSCPTVAAGGLTLGGGMGLASRRHGLACDTVEALDVVTADGRLRRVTGGDLLWALRGGGGNFGVVTALHVRTFAARSAAYFSVTYPASSADAALAAWERFAPGAPQALTSIFSLPRGGGPPTAFGQYLGDADALRRRIAPLADIAGASVTVGSADYLALQRRWAACAEGGLAACRAYRPQPFAAASLYVAKRLSTAGRRALLDAAQDATLLLDAYGGAINEVDADATAFVHRSARFSVQVLAYGPVASTKPAVARAVRRLHGISDGEAYQNYADPGLDGALRAWYGDNLPRLRAIKRRVDPDNRFRLGRQGIPPAR